VVGTFRVIVPSNDTIAQFQQSLYLLCNSPADDMIVPASDSPMSTGYKDPDLSDSSFMEIIPAASLDGLSRWRIQCLKCK
jgi:hypothetical protein